MIKLLRKTTDCQSNEAACNLHKLQVVFFADNFRECATLSAFHEEIFKQFLLNQGRSIFLKGTRL